MSYIYRLNETTVADEDGKQYTVYGIDAVKLKQAIKAKTGFLSRGSARLSLYDTVFQHRIFRRAAQRHRL